MLLTDVDILAGLTHVGHLPNSVSGANDWPEGIIPYDANRYAELTLDQIIAALRGAALRLLKRGTMAVLVARRGLLQRKNRVEREINTRLTADLDLARDEIHELTFNRGRPLPIDDQTVGIIGKFAGLLTRRRPASVTSDRQGHVEVRIGNCLNLMEPDPNIYDAIATDAPYAIGLHGYEWDSDISFSPVLWQCFMRVLKPGGYAAFFTAPRLYHRAALAAENAGFTSRSCWCRSRSRRGA